MTNAVPPTLADINAQIELLEVVQQFGTEVQEFTDWLGTLSGADLSKWLSDDSTVQFVFDGLKGAAFEFSETLSGAAENFEPLTDAASAAGNINTAVQTASTIVTIIEDASNAVGPGKATQLSELLSNLTSLSQLLTGLSLNPVIGVFLGLYATALGSAAVGLQSIAESVDERNEAINTRGGEFDVAAAQAAQAEADDRAAEAQLALSEELTRLYELRADLISGLQGGQYIVALDFAASRHPDAMRELIEIASEQGGIPSNAPVNGEILGQLERWVGSATSASFDLMTEAAAAPVGSETRASATGRLEDLMGAKSQVVGLLGPIRASVTGALEEYGYSTADPGTPAVGAPVPAGAVPGAAVVGGAAGFSRRALLIGGGIAAVVVVGVAALFAGGGGGTNGNGQSDGLGNSGSSSSGPLAASSGSSGSSAGSAGAAAVATTAPTACELRRAEPLILQVSSADIVDGVIPEQYLRRNAYDNDFPTPSFSWSTVPPETTEIVILITRLDDDDFAEFMSNPDLRGDPFRHGTERWVLSDVDPSLTSLGNTSLTIPPPAGTVQQKNSGPGVRPNGVHSDVNFVGPGFPEAHFMFAVFALCEGDGTDRGTRRGFALAEDAVAYGWFFGEPSW